MGGLTMDGSDGLWATAEGIIATIMGRQLTMLAGEGGVGARWSEQHNAVNTYRIQIGPKAVPGDHSTSGDGYSRNRVMLFPTVERLARTFSTTKKV